MGKQKYKENRGFATPTTPPKQNIQPLRRSPVTPTQLNNQPVKSKHKKSLQKNGGSFMANEFQQRLHTFSLHNQKIQKLLNQPLKKEDSFLNNITKSPTNVNQSFASADQRKKFSDYGRKENIKDVQDFHDYCVFILALIVQHDPDPLYRPFPLDLIYYYERKELDNVSKKKAAFKKFFREYDAIATDLLGSVELTAFKKEFTETEDYPSLTNLSINLETVAAPIPELLEQSDDDWIDITQEETLLLEIENKICRLDNVKSYYHFLPKYFEKTLERNSKKQQALKKVEDILKTSMDAGRKIIAIQNVTILFPNYDESFFSTSHTKELVMKSENHLKEQFSSSSTPEHWLSIEVRKIIFDRINSICIKIYGIMPPTLKDVLCTLDYTLLRQFIVNVTTRHNSPNVNPQLKKYQAELVCLLTLLTLSSFTNKITYKDLIPDDTFKETLTIQPSCFFADTSAVDTLIKVAELLNKRHEAPEPSCFERIRKVFC